MDPSSNNPPPLLSPATAVWNQPDHQVSSMANPVPMSNGHNQHPSYPEMILAAIGALKERDGSSRQAIAKYIEQVYADLPAENPVLLTRQLKLMKQSGQLIMVKHSYMLPGSASSFHTQPALAGNGSADVPESVIAEPKRRSGRPPKPKAEYHQIAVTAPPPLVDESIFVSLGLDDEPEPEPEAEPASPMVEDEIDVSHAHSVFGKRGRGRPPKLKPVRFSAEQTAPIPAPSPTSQNGSQRKVGRPRKLESVVQRLGGKLPKKVPKPTGTGASPRGRPPKYVVLPVSAGGREEQASGMIGSEGVTPEKRRGRRNGSLMKKARRLSGKPLGRPRKKLLVGREGGVNQSQVPPPPPPPSRDVLVKRLEFIQAKVKQVVSEVKPHLNSITAASALEALQELEQLTCLKVSTPVNLTNDSPTQITIVSQKPVLVPPPTHFSSPTSVPIAAPDMYPISYSTFQAAYQAQTTQH